jgi:hypothetical protein
VDSLGNQVHPIIQILFQKNNKVFQEDSAAIHTAETVQSSFEKYEVELQHLPWPARSPTRLEYHRTTLVSSGDLSEEQIPTSNSSKAS